MNCFVKRRPWFRSFAAVGIATLIAWTSLGAIAPTSAHAIAGAFVDTTSTDFGSGTATGLSTSGDQLSAPSIADVDFDGSALPPAWNSYGWDTGGSAIVSGGEVQLNGFAIASDTMYAPGTRLTMNATFTADAIQAIGFSRNWATTDPDPQFYSDGVDLYAFVQAGNQQVIPGAWHGSEHEYRIDFNATWADFSIDGTYITSLPLQEHLTRRIHLLDTTTAGTGLRVSSVRVGPKDATISTTYPGPGLPSGWTSKPWAIGGTDSVASGELTQDGTIVQTDSMRPTAQRIEIRAKFTGDPYQIVGWSSAEPMSSARPNPTFNTVDGGALHAYVDPWTYYVIPGSWFGAYHTYRIDWFATKADFYIDGLWKQTISTAPSGNLMRGITADGILDNASLVTDYVTHTPINEYTNTDFNGSAIPTGWVSSVVSGGGATTVGSGRMTLDGTLVGRDATYLASQRYEVRAKFSGGEYQGIQWGNGLNDTENPGFRTFLAGSPLYAYISPTSHVAIPGTYTGAFHTYRVENNSSHTEFYIDNVLKASLPSEIGWSYRPSVFDAATDGSTLIVDSSKLTSLDGGGTFISRVYDAGVTSDWTNMSWNGTFPSGSRQTFSYRVGNTAVPNGTWSNWQTVSSSGATINATGRYAQYRVVLERSPILGSPVVNDVTLSYRQLFTDTTIADFTAGTHLDTQVNAVGDGAVGLAPAVSSGNFTSRVIDGGAGSVWSRLTWTATVPVGSSLGVSYRVGNTSTPDGTWSAFTPATSGASISAAGQYIQYSVALTPDGSGNSPSFNSITLRT